MRGASKWLIYLLLVALPAVAVWVILEKGFVSEPAKGQGYVPAVEASTLSQFFHTLWEDITHPMAILLLQIITILATSRIFGWVCRRIGQPTVIGEIFAGIFLGPSFISYWWPAFGEFLFPLQSQGNLQFLSQIGLILFMFIVGMELDLKVIKNRAQEALIIGHASIAIPFLMGVLLAFGIYETYAPDNIPFQSFALFMGISLSITAFPVLARIVRERGLNQSPVGNLALTSAAINDITAWCMLAIVIAIAKAGSLLSSFFIVFMALAFVLFMLFAVRPFLHKLGEIYSNKESLSKPVVAMFFVTLLISSWITEVIGIHALFGAFMAGLVMPPNVNFRNIFIEKIEDVASILLLPLFFVSTGLRTQISALQSVEMWELCGVVVLIAVAGKFIGTSLPARTLGMSWRDSLTLGALMNTRGLMELIVLNIGYDLGILSPELFAILVIMALVTTLMTGPVLNLIDKFSAERTRKKKQREAARKYRILVSFGNPERGRTMIRLAASLTGTGKSNSEVTALHLSPVTDLNEFNAQEYEKDSFKPILEESEAQGMAVETVFRPTHDIDKTLAETANTGQFDLMIVGLGRSIYEGTLFGKLLSVTARIINPEKLIDALTGKDRQFENMQLDDRTRMILKSAQVPVGVFIDHDLQEIRRVIVPVHSVSDSFLLLYVRKFIQNEITHVTLLDMDSIIRSNPELMESIRAVQEAMPGRIELVGESAVETDWHKRADLMMVSLESWKKLAADHTEWLENSPSVLIMKP